jgi:hypothetical protein
MHVCVDNHRFDRPLRQSDPIGNPITTLPRPAPTHSMRGVRCRRYAF